MFILNIYIYIYIYIYINKGYMKKDLTKTKMLKYTQKKISTNM